MRFAIYGVGGVGGYFGARLAQAGEDVYFIARGKHLEAIQGNGLKLESIQGDYLQQPARAFEHPEDIGPVDVVIIGVKAWQVPDAAWAIRPMIGEKTLVLPLQNGVDAPSHLAEVLDSPSNPLPNVIGGLCRLVSMVAAPGVIRHTGMVPYIAFNRMDGQPDERVERLRQAFERAGVNVEVPADIYSALWAKFMFIASFGGVGSVTRVPAGILRSVPETRNLLVHAIREIEAVGRAHGAALPEAVADQVLAQIDGLPEGATASMQRDIMEGRPSELEAQTGAVVRLGSSRSVDTSTNAFLYAALLPLEKRARLV